MLMLMLNCNALAIVAPLPVFDVTAASTKGCHVLFARSQYLSLNAFSLLTRFRFSICAAVAF